MRLLKGTLLIMICAMSLVFQSQAQTSRQAPVRVFEHVKPGTVKDLPMLGKEAMGSVLVRPRLNAIQGVGKGGRLYLNLERGLEWVGTITRIDKRTDTSYSIFGDLENIPHGYFILTVEGDAMIANIDAATYNMQFLTRYVRDGIHLLYQLDTNQYDPCADDETSVENWEPVTPEPFVPGLGGDRGDFSPAGDFEPSACTRPAPFLDVAIFYTNIARSAMGGVNAANAQAQAAVDAANQAYQQSNINLTMRLVYRGEVTYNESGTFEQHRNRLTDTSDGVMDGVHGIRDQYRADDVILFVDDSDFCGIAWCQPVTAARAFCIVKWDCAVGNNSFAHEIGHNQGCAHNREDAGSVCNLYSYSYGHRFIGNNGSRYRTIMSYASGSYDPSTRIRYFSNPNVSFQGQPTGVNIGSSGEAHNAQTITNTRLDRENFRLLDVWVDLDYTFFIELGIFDFPFNTAAEGVAAITNTIDTNLIDFPTLHIKASARAETLTISKRMRIQACGGLVRIGSE